MDGSAPSVVADPPENNQRPRLYTCPTYFTTLGQDAVDLSEHAGLILDDWQQFVLTDSLGERPNGKWSAFEVGLIVPRQNGKGAIIEARQLAAMFLTKDPIIIYSAHQFKTAKQMYRRIRDLCKQTPDLDKLVKNRYRQSNEETGIELDWGRLQFFARSAGAGRGFTGDTMFFDEAYNLDPELISDMLPTLSAVDNAQVWYVSSAGMESSEQLEKIRNRGIAGNEPRLAFFEWSAPEGIDLADERWWCAANPAADIRLDIEFVREVEFKNMDEEKFSRERLGIWKAPEPEEDDTVMDLDIWKSLGSVGDVTLRKKVALAVDMTPDRKWVSIGAAVRTDDDRIHVEVGYHAKPGPGLIRMLLRLIEKFEPAALVIDRQSPAFSLVPALERAEIEPEVTTAGQMVQACGGFFDDYEAKALHHTGDPLLIAAVDGHTTRPVTGGGWAWQRKGNGTISPLVAVTLAHWALGIYDKPVRRTASPSIDPAALIGGDDIDIMDVAF